MHEHMHIRCINYNHVVNYIRRHNCILCLAINYLSGRASTMSIIVDFIAFEHGFSWSRKLFCVNMRLLQSAHIAFGLQDVPWNSTHRKFLQLVLQNIHTERKTTFHRIPVTSYYWFLGSTPFEIACVVYGHWATQLRACENTGVCRIDLACLAMCS